MIRLYINSETTVIGAALAVLQNNQEKLLSLTRKTLTPTEQTLNTVDKEKLAVVLGLTIFHDIITNRPFQILSPNIAITHVHWGNMLENYDCEIIHMTPN